eukprot:CAMPEP_0194717234 /NCGR_PEP_ID=MMETSP0296-20130528/8906_1 /TAXON_ID=39354 /ORGANISM="Heterosigma akashiwo, Strain CCMP2393" /LENGTH=50 /DNA_ID=CAMNT_0039618011 /DNA_START=11 /DNA_END=159 /DNA_ORIENTATION=-
MNYKRKFTVTRSDSTSDPAAPSSRPPLTCPPSARSQKPSARATGGGRPPA